MFSKGTTLGNNTPKVSENHGKNTPKVWGIIWELLLHGKKTHQKNGSHLRLKAYPKFGAQKYRVLGVKQKRKQQQKHKPPRAMIWLIFFCRVEVYCLSLELFWLYFLAEKLGRTEENHVKIHHSMNQTDWVTTKKLKQTPWNIPVEE